MANIFDAYQHRNLLEVLRQKEMEDELFNLNKMLKQAEAAEALQNIELKKAQASLALAKALSGETEKTAALKNFETYQKLKSSLGDKAAQEFLMFAKPLDYLQAGEDYSDGGDISGIVSGAISKALGSGAGQQLAGKQGGLQDESLSFGEVKPEHIEDILKKISPKSEATTGAKDQAGIFIDSPPPLDTFIAPEGQRNQYQAESKAFTPNEIDEINKILAEISRYQPRSNAERKQKSELIKSITDKLLTARIESVKEREKQNIKREIELEKDMPQALAFVDSLENASQMLSARIDDALSKINNLSAGYGGYLKDIPLSGAYSLDKALSEIKSKNVIETISEMKAQSRTGATGLGNMQIREFEAIENALGSLDQKQDPEELKKKLQIIKVNIDNALKRSKKMFKDKFGFEPVVEDYSSVYREILGVGGKEKQKQQLKTDKLEELLKEAESLGIPRERVLKSIENRRANRVGGSR